MGILLCVTMPLLLRVSEHIALKILFSVLLLWGLLLFLLSGGLSIPREIGLGVKSLWRRIFGREGR